MGKGHGCGGINKTPGATSGPKQSGGVEDLTRSRTAPERPADSPAVVAVNPGLVVAGVICIRQLQNIMALRSGVRHKLFNSY